MKKTILLLLCALAAAGCDKGEKLLRGAARKSGEIAGAVGSEIATGISEGINETMDEKHDALLDTIGSRASVRKFDASKEIDDATVEKLLRAAMSAPSAMDRRPWSFIAVRDAAKLKALADRSPYARIDNGARLVICVCGENGGTDNGFWIQDCAAASQNILLAAHALGLGAVWTGVFPGERVGIVREILGIPETHTPLNLIVIGYPAEKPAPKNKWNPEAIHYDNW